jgi:membrane glycosyltransferase
VTWNGQARDAHALSWGTALAGLWPQTLFGTVVIAALALQAPLALAWALPLLVGFPLAVPFAVLTADPRLGAWMAARGLCATPEEIAVPWEISALAGVPAASPLPERVA